MTPERQAAEVDRVKRSESGMILNPITLGPDRPLREAYTLMRRFKISGVPIVDGQGRLIGIITNLITAVWLARWMFELMLGRRGTVKATLSI